MGASKTAKKIGCPSVRAVAKWLGYSEQRLYRWYRDKPELFRAVCLGYVKENGDGQLP